MSLVGERLAKYDIVSEIGHGGMSVVYRAHDTQLRRDVAVKVMHAFLAEQPDARERFHREAVAVARLKHPHIIEIFDYSGEEAASSYIVTELVEGVALSELLKRGPVAPPEAGLIIARPIADALSHAHKSGVIHRDLKPENILIGQRGALKLTDFGIARILDNHTMTMTGTLLGSPAYMAPEYIEGYPTDERADIFSFGAMLYQMVVGKLPFEAPSPHALLKRIATGDYAPPQQQNPKVPARLAALITRCLAKLPENRFASAAELLAEIDAILNELELDWQAELPHILAATPEQRGELEARLKVRYLALGKQRYREGAQAHAIACFDRVLSIEPDNAEVRATLKRIGRRTGAARAAKLAALGLAGATVVTLIVGGYVATRPPPPRPTLAVGPTVPPQQQPAPEERNVTFVLQGRGDLYVDEHLVQAGLSGNHAMLIAPGPHRVRFSGSEKTDARDLDVPASGPVPPVALNVESRRPTAPPSKVTPALPTGQPTLQTPPAALATREVAFRAVNVLTVYLDDQPEPVARDRFGAFALTLSHGTHKLRFTNPLAYDLEELVRVDENNPPQTIVVRLQPLPAKLFIDGAPDGATADVAGRRWLINAQTRNDPIFVQLQPGSGQQQLEVVVRANGQEVRRTVEFRAGQEQRLDVRFDPL